MTLPGCGEPVGSGGGSDAALAPDGGVAITQDAGSARDAGSDASTTSSPPDAGPPDASSGVTSSGVRVIVEPSDDASALVAAISGATSSVHMTMYYLSSHDVINALIAQHAAGHEVRVVLNQHFPVTSMSNRSVYDMLRSAGVSVHWAPSTFQFTHEKCVIIDRRQAWIMTMNATVTSPTANREYLAITEDPASVSEAEAIFAADYAGRAITPSGPLVVSPVNAQSVLDGLIYSATSTLDVEAEELGDRNTTTALVARARVGVRVRVVLPDNSLGSSAQAAVNALTGAGIQVVQTHSPYIHAKAMVVDGTQAFVGSENLSYTSLTQNRELGIVFSDAAAVSAVSSTIATDFAAGVAL